MLDNIQSVAEVQFVVWSVVNLWRCEMQWFQLVVVVGLSVASALAFSKLRIRRRGDGSIIIEERES